MIKILVHSFERASNGGTSFFVPLIRGIANIRSVVPFFFAFLLGGGEWWKVEKGDVVENIVDEG